MFRLTSALTDGQTDEQQQIQYITCHFSNVAKKGTTYEAFFNIEKSVSAIKPLLVILPAVSIYKKMYVREPKAPASMTNVWNVSLYNSTLHDDRFNNHWF